MTLSYMYLPRQEPRGTIREVEGHFTSCLYHSLYVLAYELHYLHALYWVYCIC